MTEKQKEAIQIINRIRDWHNINHKSFISEDEYMTVLEAIMDNDCTYYPYIPTTPQPLDPYYQDRWNVTCVSNQSEKTK